MMMTTKREQKSAVRLIDPAAESSESNQLLGKTVQRLRKAAGVSQQELGEVLNMHQSAISRVESGQQQLGPSDLVTLSHFFGVKVDDILGGVVDYWSLAKKFGRRPPLPERYQKWAYSKVRDLLPILLYLRDKQGAPYVNRLLNNLGMNSFVLMNPDQSVGTLLWFDLLKEGLHDGSLSRKKLSEITEYTRSDSVHGFLAPLYRAQTEPLPLLQMLILNAPHYEENYDYRIESAQESHLVFSATPKGHLTEILEREPELREFTCSYREQFASHFPLYIGRNPILLTSKERSSPTGGRCLYEARPA